MHPHPDLYFLFVHLKKMFVCVDACLGFLQFIDQEGNGDSHTDGPSSEPSVSPWHKRGAPPPPGWNDSFGDQVLPSAPQDHGHSDTNTPYPPPPGMIGMPTPEAWEANPSLESPRLRTLQPQGTNPDQVSVTVTVTVVVAARRPQLLQGTTLREPLTWILTASCFSSWL